MTAAKKISEKFETKIFDDVSILQRKWQAALRPGDRLPSYEDVMLGSLGRLADHIVLMKENDGALEVSRTGRYVQKWLDDERWDIPLAALSPDCAHRARRSRGQRAGQRPALSGDGALRARRPGPDLRRAGAADRVALGRHADRYLCQRARRPYNLLDTIFSATDEGVLSLAAIRDAGGRPFDFQIVHLNQGAARLLKKSSTDLMWRRLSAGGKLLCATEIIERLFDIIGGGNAGQFEIDSEDRCLKSGRYRVRRHAVADGFGCHGDQTARILVSAVVRQQPDADVGVRRREHRIHRRQ